MIMFSFSRYIKFIIFEKIRNFLLVIFIVFIILNLMHIDYLELFSSYQLFLLSILFFIVVSNFFIKVWSNRVDILSALKENKTSSLIVTDNKIIYQPPYSNEKFQSLLSEITFEEIEVRDESDITYKYFLRTKNKRIELDDTIGINMKLLKKTLRDSHLVRITEEIKQY